MESPTTWHGVIQGFPLTRNGMAAAVSAVAHMRALQAAGPWNSLSVDGLRFGLAVLKHDHSNKIEKEKCKRKEKKRCADKNGESER